MQSYFPPSPAFLCTPLCFVYEYFDRWIDLLNLPLFGLRILTLIDQYNQKAINGFTLKSCGHSWDSLVPHRRSDDRNIGLAKLSLGMKQGCYTDAEKNIGVVDGLTKGSDWQ